MPSKSKPSAESALAAAREAGIDPGDIVEEVTGMEPGELIDSIEYLEDTDVLVSSRPPGWLALVLLGGVTGGATAGLAYAVVVQGDVGALQSLSTVATLGVGALAAMLGMRSE